MLNLCGIENLYLTTCSKIMVICIFEQFEYSEADGSLTLHQS